MRSSPNVEAATPNTSGTAHARAQSSTRSNGAGEVNRLATNTSTTCPWVTAEVDTSRIGHTASTICLNRNRRPNSATTGSAPSIFSILGTPYRARRPPTADRATPNHHRDQHAAPPNHIDVRNTGLAGLSIHDAATHPNRGAPACVRWDGAGRWRGEPRVAAAGARRRTGV